jgi:hypothetical protein
VSKRDASVCRLALSRREFNVISITCGDRVEVVADVSNDDGNQ